MNLIVLPVIDSTNSYAQQLIREEKATEQTVILALEQTDGRGQRGKKWESENGMGLFASFIFLPERIPAISQFLLNKAIALGVAEYIESKANQKVSIKWPNDLIIDNEKISGILIESNLRGPFFSSLVVGVGINLNQRVFHGSFETTPVSLKLITGSSYQPESEIRELYRFVWNKYQQFMNREFERIEDEYRSRIYKKDQLAVFLKGDKIFSAVLKDVDDNGAAILQINENIEHVSHPDVRFAPEVCL